MLNVENRIFLRKDFSKKEENGSVAMVNSKSDWQCCIDIKERVHKPLRSHAGSSSGGARVVRVCLGVAVVILNSGKKENLFV